MIVILIGNRHKYQQTCRMYVREIKKTLKQMGYQVMQWFVIKHKIDIQVSFNIRDVYTV